MAQWGAWLVAMRCHMGCRCKGMPSPMAACCRWLPMPSPSTCPVASASNSFPRGGGEGGMAARCHTGSRHGGCSPPLGHVMQLVGTPCATLCWLPPCLRGTPSPPWLQQGGVPHMARHGLWLRHGEWAQGCAAPCATPWPRAAAGGCC